MDYFTVFFKTLSPSFLGVPAHLPKLEALLAKYKDNNSKTYFCKVLKEEIDKLKEVLAVRAAVKK
jgi:iron uptake system EfeUOB component EfeO/EfeM